MNKKQIFFLTAAGFGAAFLLRRAVREPLPLEVDRPPFDPADIHMQYRTDRRGQPLSILGYGCMRFTKKGGRIDLWKAEQEVMTAIRAGVNYFDTAYLYPGNEAAIGEILHRNHCREQVFLATKLPHLLVHTPSDFNRLFQEQIRRLQTDYVDFYLIHMLTDLASWERLVQLGILSWIQAKKKTGQIRNLGFSFHGNTEMFLNILAAHDWDFCQIQYNYMDEFSQGGRKGLLAAQAKGIPVIVMEPLRGGKLVNMLPEAAKRLIAAYPVQRSAAEWALRWVWNQPEVTVVLSGMNSMDMVEENLRIAEDVSPDSLSPEDMQLFAQLRSAINGAMAVPCTSCGYCLPCPRNVDIPGAFRCYNLVRLEGWFSAQKEYIKVSALCKDATAASCCINCGKCEARCPQEIAIRHELKQAAAVLETPLYKGARLGAKLLGIW